MLAVLMMSLIMAAHAASVSIGRVYEFESANYDTYSIKYSINQLVYIRETDSPSAFRIVPGLFGSGVSLQCEDDHKYYLRHQGFIIKAHPDDGTDLFKKDATFIVVPGLNGGIDDVSFRSVNYNTHYIRHQNYQLKLHSGSDELFKDDASWAPVEIPLLEVGYSYQFQSVNYQGYRIRHLVNQEIWLKPEFYGPSTFKVVNGLYNSSGISFQCVEGDNYYLRHQGSILKAHVNDNTELFKKDATFIPEYGLTNEEGTVSLKSWNYPTRYIRHQGFQLKLHEKGSDDLYKNDATWKPMYVPGN